ncbi:GNAT family N-acetyltransferase [Halorussus gelatinilyticus]|uniref:GNAT family N-acetyltransferase n=1 Tax=Halorussus gelatinilyticus TaxID=2937524 RepID=A0A8U0ILS3_9EURY|nr:GNAT family N-acetyltransferase [Halorussus gelatinilyticus]UPW01561.1 GNAT family N-acetyltransferase [Halorussus gelatinilyticus]
MVRITRATADDRLGVRRVLDAAMLDVRDDLRERVAAGDVLVASEGDEDSGERETPVLGALVLVPLSDDAPDASGDEAAHIDAVAVRRARRGRGVGTALVRAAAAHRARLTAEFDPGVRPFYDALGFEISPVEGDDDRLRGRYDADGAD